MRDETSTLVRADTLPLGTFHGDFISGGQMYMFASSGGLPRDMASWFSRTRILLPVEVLTMWEALPVQRDLMLPTGESLPYLPGGSQESSSLSILHDYLSEGLGTSSGQPASD